jgi:hypothetical protein
VADPKHWSRCVGLQVCLTTLSYAAHTCGQKPNDAPKCTRTWVSA